MFGRSFRLLNLFGFEIKLDASWILLALLISWTLAAGVFPTQFPGLARGEYWLLGIFGALGLFLSIILHELAHSLVARKHGIAISGITLFVFGGVAEIQDEPPSPRAEFLMAIAGPLASFAVGLAFLLSGAIAQILSAPGPLIGLLSYLALANFVLGAFNMLPAFPLDGGRVLRAALWHRSGDSDRATRRAARIGQFFGASLIAFGIFMFLSGNLVAGFWWVLIGLFLTNIARAHIFQLDARRSLRNMPVARFMTEGPVTVPASLSLQDFVANFVQQYFHDAFPVIDGERTAGLIALRQLRQIPREKWPVTTVCAVAEPLADEITIEKDAPAEAALRKMTASKSSQLLVLDQEGTLVGIVTMADLLKPLAVRLSLERIGGSEGGADRLAAQRMSSSPAAQ